jgi:glucose-6-phosphate dehydrogenase assembly protein OpcA
VITPWRAALASAFDTVQSTATSVVVRGNPVDPSAQLLAGWLSSRLGLYVPVEKAEGKYISSVELAFANGHTIDLRNEGYKLVLRRPNQMDSIAPFPSRTTGDLMAEELRRLDADQSYAEALGAVTGHSDLNSRPSVRSHIWHDPALAAQEG